MAWTCARCQRTWHRTKTPVMYDRQTFCSNRCIEAHIDLERMSRD